MKLATLFLMTVLGVFSCRAAVPVVGDDLYRVDRDVFQNLDAFVRAVDAETNACVVTTPVPRGFVKGDPAREKGDAVAADVFKLCDNTRVYFLDVRSAFLKPDGSLKGEFYEKDGLSLNAAGRAKLAATVQPLVDWVAQPTDKPAPCTKIGWKHFYTSNVHLMRAGRHWWWDRVLKCYAQAERLRRTRGGRLDVLLIGDSITHHFEDAGAAFYAEICEGREVMNLANGGDLPYQQDWLVRNGIVDGLEAKLVQIMIGTNDHDDPAKRFERIRKLVERVRAKMPAATILLCDILPRLAEKDEEEMKRNEAWNPRLAELCDGQKTVFLTVGDPMRRAIGAPEAERRKLAGDLLHPSPIMYRHWLTCLRPYLPKPAGDIAPTRHVPVFTIGKHHAKDDPLAYVSSDLNGKLAAAVLAEKPAYVYLRYRTSDADASGLLITRTKDESYHSRIGFWADGREHDAVILLEGWSRSGRPLKADADMSFTFNLKNAEIDLLEVGVVRQGKGYDK